MTDLEAFKEALATKWNAHMHYTIRHYEDKDAYHLQILFMFVLKRLGETPRQMNQLVDTSFPHFKTKMKTEVNALYKEMFFQLRERFMGRTGDFLLEKI